MWPSDRPLPMGGMPCRSTNVMNASSWRLMISNEWSVPRWSCHISIGATGSARVFTGTIDEYWLHTPTAATPAATARMRGGELADGGDELVPHGGRVLFGGSRPVQHREGTLRRAHDAGVVADEHGFQVGGPDVDPDRVRHRAHSRRTPRPEARRTVGTVAA